MRIFVSAVSGVAAVLLGTEQYGWGACALAVALFTLWWDSQPGPSLDQDICFLPDQRPRPKYPKGK